MEAVLKAPSPMPWKGVKAFLWAFVLGAIVMGVGLAISAISAGEVPLKPCGTCVNCVCPVGMNGPKCGCPR